MQVKKKLNKIGTKLEFHSVFVCKKCFVFDQYIQVPTYIYMKINVCEWSPIFWQILECSRILWKILHEIELILSLFLTNWLIASFLSTTDCISFYGYSKEYRNIYFFSTNCMLNNLHNNQKLNFSSGYGWI